MTFATSYRLGRLFGALPILLLFCSLSAFAQQTTYRINYNQALLDLPGGLVETPSGNYLFAGTNTSFIPIYGTLTEVDAIGTVVWSKGYTGSIATQINDVKNVPAGGYIATGANDPGLMLMRTDATGNVSWSYRYRVSGASGEYGNRVLPTSDGGFVVAGYVYDADPDGAGPLVRQDSSNMMCMKVDANGTLLWGNVFFFSTSFIDDHALTDVAEVSDGYIFTGYVNESGNDGPTDAVIIKTDFNGNRQWSYRFGGSNSQSADAIKSTSPTQVVVTGGDEGEPYFLRLNASGSVIGGSVYDFGFFSLDQAFGTDITLTNDGNYAISGTYIGFNIPPVFSSFLFKASPSGSLIFDKYYSPTSTSFLSVSLLPRAIQASDSSYMILSTGFGTTGGYDYELIKADKDGLLNNTDCPEDDMDLSRSSYTPGLTSFTPVTSTAVSRSSLTVASININPSSNIACRTVVCNGPPAPTSVTASNNNFCPGGSATINASGSGANVTYNVFASSSGGTALGSTPYSVSPTTTTTYYVEANDNNNPLCSSARVPVTVTVLPPPPARPGTISGPNPTCPGNRSYSISAVTNATSYNWSVSGGGTVSGSGTTVNINWTTPGTWTVSVTASNTCGTSNSRTLSVVVSDPPPAQPGAITGNTTPCPGSESYSITSVTGATSYSWSVSGGGTISGTGTSATVNWTTSGGPYTISVTASNGCGTSSARTLTVNVQPGAPTSIGSITGNTNVCVGSENYSIPTVAGATNYTWSVSGGGSVTGGQGITNATVNWTSGGTYTVSVTASNSCGNISATPLTVTVAAAPPATPGPISGVDTVCTGNQTYTIPPVANADSYTWSIGSGGTIVSGANSTSFTVNWTTGGLHTISVTATNACGTSSPATYDVLVSPGTPPTPGPISGNTSVCAGSEIYSITAVSGATSYAWTVSGGGSITGGQGTNSITVDWTTSGGPYTVSVVPSNICGSGSSSTLQVTVLPDNPSPPASVSGNSPVCFGAENYTAATVTGAIGYTWSVSGGGTITDGQGTATAEITWATAGTWVISVTAQNPCGSSTATTDTVEVLPANPATPGNITGPSGVCPGTVTYSIPLVPGADGYTWTISGGGTITSGQGTDTIEVDWGAVSGTYTVAVTANNICGSSVQSTISVNVTPGPPTGTPVIAGDIGPCPGVETYTVSGVTGAGTYNWTVNGGGSIVTGQGTSSIDIDWTTTGGPYTIEVTPENTCGTGTPGTLDVTVDGPSDIGTTVISGNDTPCPGSETYTIPAVPNATGYTWTLSGGGTITGGQGTTSITVNWNTSGGPYTLSVTADNPCGSSSAATYAVTVQPGPPATPGAISGLMSVCEGSGTETYTISSVTDATGYTWTVSGGGSITSGQGTTTATIDWTGTPGNYTISVTADNPCGTSSAATATVTIVPGPPAQPGAISGPASVCPGTETYSVGSVTNATGYTWTLSGGGTIASGQGSNSITVNWTTSGGPYQVSVIAENNCGASTAQTLDVTVQPSPTAPTVTTSGDTICEGEAATITATGSTGGAITYNIFDQQTGGSNLGVSPLTVNPTVTTTYYVEVINDLGCRYSGGRVPVTVYVSPAPGAPTITGSTDGVCFGEEASLTATVAGGGNITWWNAASGGTQLGTGNTLNTGELTSTTTFYAEAISANGCASLSGRLPVTVDVAPLPTVTLTTDAANNSIFINQALTAIAEPDDYSNYEFFLNGEQVQIDSIHTWASSILEDGDVISVIATDGGCVGEEVEISIIVSDYPNAFTPNGDGRNDVFLAGFDLVIINRWGQELYSGMDGWDGTFNGDRVSPGTYYYILRVQDITDTETVLKGSVMVHY